MSPRGPLQTTVEETSATAEVRAIYLTNAGLDTSALINGVTLADPAMMVGCLLANDVRVPSF